MWYTYKLDKTFEEIPCYYNGHVDCYMEETYNSFQVKMDSDDNIDFVAGIIGNGVETNNIKDYQDLLDFINEHYNKIQDTNDIDCINELKSICKEKITPNENNQN